MTRPDLAIVFHVEPADRSVGIMAEGFSAWDADPAAPRCDCEDVAPPMVFRWYDGETGDPCEPPPNRLLVEGALRGFVAAYYAQESYDGTPESDPEPAAAGGGPS